MTSKATVPDMLHKLSEALHSLEICMSLLTVMSCCEPFTLTLTRHLMGLQTTVWSSVRRDSTHIAAQCL